jgi:hypothetical protein
MLAMSKNSGLLLGLYNGAAMSGVERAQFALAPCRLGRLKCQDFAGRHFAHNHGRQKVSEIEDEPIRKGIHSI